METDVRRLLLERGLNELRGTLSSLNSDIRITQVNEWPQSRSSAKCILEIIQAIDNLYPDNIPNRINFRGGAGSTGTTTKAGTLLHSLKQSIATLCSICNDKIAILTAIVGASSQLSELQTMGAAVQKLNSSLAEIGKAEATETMSADEIEADLISIQKLFDIQTAKQASPQSSTLSIVPSIPVSKITTIKEESTTPPSSPARSGKSKKDAIDSPKSKVSSFFKKTALMLGKKDKSQTEPIPTAPEPEPVEQPPQTPPDTAEQRANSSKHVPTPKITQNREHSRSFDLPSNPRNSSLVTITIDDLPSETQSTKSDTGEIVAVELAGSSASSARSTVGMDSKDIEEHIKSTSVLPDDAEEVDTTNTTAETLDDSVTSPKSEPTATSLLDESSETLVNEPKLSDEISSVSINSATSDEFTTPRSSSEVQPQTFSTDIHSPPSSSKVSPPVSSKQVYMSDQIRDRSATSFETSASRMKRRAAVFQKSSDRRIEVSGVEEFAKTFDEQTMMEESVNIWDEPKENHIIFETDAKPDARIETFKIATSSEDNRATMLPSQPNQEVLAGTLNQLVKHLTSSKGVDGRTLQTFLLTYTSFTTPKVLLIKLIQRYHIPTQRMVQVSSKPGKDMEAVARTKQLRVVNFLRKWLDLCFLDFNEELIGNVFQFCEDLRTGGGASLATLIDNALLAKMVGLAKKKQTHEDQPPPPVIMPKKSNPANQLEFMDIDPLEMARQITLIDYELFCSIRPAELLNQSWNKPKLKHKSPHVLEMIQRFNTISKWLCSVMLQPETVKERAKVMTNVVRLGKYLLELNNFNGLMAVLSALQNSAVYRLNLTKEALPSKISKRIIEFSALMDPRQNSANYRNALALAKPPAVPYLGHYLSALTFIEEGNPVRLHGLINFKKCRLISKVIVNLLQYQVGKRYNLVVVDSIKDFISNQTPQETEDELYDLSLLREPRQTANS